MLNHPRILALFCLLGMWCCALLGAWLREHFHTQEEAEKTSLGIVISATLTLLGLVIGFTFSMATSRYDQRKLYEEQEANAIGTEYVRAGLLPPSEARETRVALQKYLQLRIDFYQADYGLDLVRLKETTSSLQTQLWGGVVPTATAQPTPVMALVVNGMNDVLNSSGYTQYSWWNRIPVVAWVFLIIIAMFANLLVGYSTKRNRSGTLLLLVLPLVVSTSFFLVSDIDSPRGGLIRAVPQNLIALQQSLQSAQ